MAKKTDLESRLEELDKLKSKGTITEDEYATRRAAVMTEAPAPTVVVKKGGFPFSRVGCLGIIGVVVLVIIIAAVASSGGSSNNKTSSNGSVTPLTANQAQVGDLLLTVNAVDTNYTDKTFPAEDGTYYVTVDITGKNTGHLPTVSTCSTSTSKTRPGSRTTPH